jgi:outer membrane protein TolC
MKMDQKTKMKNNGLKVLLAGLIVLCNTLGLFAQQHVITLEEAINTSLKNNRDIQIAVMNVKKADAAVNQAFGYALPSLDLTGNFSHFIRKPKTAFPDFEIMLSNATYQILFADSVLPRDGSKIKPMKTSLQSFAQTNNYTTELTLTQTLFSSAVFKGIGASEKYYNLAKADLLNTVSKTVLNVQKAFYGVLLSKEVAEITKSSFENAQANFDNVKALYKQGMVSEFDMLQAEVQVENLRPAVIQSDINYSSAKDGLKILLGFAQNEEIELSGDFSYQPYKDLSENDLLDEAMEFNYDIRVLALKKEVDEAFVELDVSEYWPNIAAFGNYSYAGSSDKWDFQNYSSMTVGLSFSINLWQGNRTKNAVEQSTITYQQTEQQLNQLKDFTATTVKNKILEMDKVQTLLEVQDRTVSVAERSYQIAKVRYREGAGSQLELQNADLALRQAKLNRIQSVYQFLSTKYELEQILGRTSTEYTASFKEIED